MPNVYKALKTIAFCHPSMFPCLLPTLLSKPLSLSLSLAWQLLFPVSIYIICVLCLTAVT
jgi:hypothetical protein